MQLPKGNNLLHSGQILPRQPTHLHSHLLLLDFYFLMEQAKAKESASNRTTLDNIVQTGQRTEKRRAATNSTYPKVAVQCFVGQFCVYLKCCSPNEVQW
jgi:hypothetical protein